jgi:hypothetical protein|tara:strand:- start:1824 stop:2042 length:219 start_codon:yes stop_codon:yes gene_type:complete
MNKHDEKNNNNLKISIWFNLFIGLYNIYMFNQIDSIFHLVLGSLNVGVWVFFRDKLISPRVKIEVNKSSKRN